MKQSVCMRRPDMIPFKTQILAALIFSAVPPASAATYLGCFQKGNN